MIRINGKFGGHHTYLLLAINCNYPLKGCGKNSGTGDATSYHSKREQTATNLFSDKDYIAYIYLMKEWCDARGVEIWSYCLML